jgi:hypothetical protein
MRTRFAAPLLLAALSCAQSKPDFAGRWVVDKAHSTAKTSFVKHADLKGPPVPLAAAGHELDWIRPETITYRAPSLVVVDEAVE